LFGDEFVALLGGACSERGASALAQRQEQALSAPLDIGGESSSITISIGIALAEPGEASAAELLHRADMTMYAAKSLPGASHRGYEASLDAG